MVMIGHKMVVNIAHEEYLITSSFVANISCGCHDSLSWDGIHTYLHIQETCHVIYAVCISGTLHTTTRAMCIKYITEP